VYACEPIPPPTLATPLPGNHGARRVLHQEERAVHVDAEHLARIGEKSTLRMSVAFVARDAGVVHHDVQRAGRRVDGGARVLLDRDVAVDEHGHVAAAQGVAQLLAGLVLDVRDADLGAMLP